MRNKKEEHVDNNDHLSANSNSHRSGALCGASDSNYHNSSQVIEYHKGEPCLYKDGVLCQEGYCFRCALRGEGCTAL